MRFIPVSIRRQGLQFYLNKTASRHNGFDYRDFCAMYNANVNVSNMARAFNLKSRGTMLHWRRLYKEDLDKSMERIRRFKNRKML